ncbi:16S rRNA (guanine(966)-N(2))-methyltransferase RsmD [candidate division KSB1 bacterium]|nr:16S rRNA (guanine(966)-N(2))-methyltransferase RsmD [candidate division KSB1 bacterium]
MRIIGGIRRGHTILCPKSSFVRPTTDFIREYIYNVLSDKVRDSVVLDLFAGTGSLGLEALSRGAATAVFVEKNRNVSQILSSNISKLKFDANSQVIVNDVFSFLKKKHEFYHYFDLIFADPPYYSNDYDKLLNLISEKQWLIEHGLLVVEHDVHLNLMDSYDNIRLIRSKKAGITAISIFEQHCRG